MHTTNLLEIDQEAIRLGVQGDYILMDSWFCFASLIAKLAIHVPFIGMAKDLTSNF